MKLEKPCSDWQNLMIDALGSELEKSLAEPFHKHIESCAECGPLWQDYLKIQAASRVWEESLQTKSSSDERILKFAAAKAPEQKTETQMKHAPRRWSWLFGPSAVAFATLCLAVGFSYLAHQMRPDSHKTEPLTSTPSPTVAPKNDQEATSAPGQALEDDMLKLPSSAPHPSKALGATSSGAAHPAPPPQKNLVSPTAPKLHFREEPSSSKAMSAEPQAQSELKPSSAVSVPDEGSDRDLRKGTSEESGAQPQSPAPVVEQVAPVDEKQNFGGTASEAQKKEKPRRAKDLENNKYDKAKSPPSLEQAPEGEFRLDGTLATQDQNALIASAKSKIEAKQYEAALADLRKAEAIGKNLEVEKLIRFCEEQLELTTKVK